MKVLRWLVSGLVWVVAGLLGLVGALLCVTIILLPLGIPVILLARRLFSLSAKLVLPRAARHPVQESAQAMGKAAEGLKDAVSGGQKDVGRRARRAKKKALAGG